MSGVRVIPGGVRIALRLKPKGGRDAVEGWGTAADGTQHLKARVRTVAADGKANAALIALLAKTLNVSKSDVTIVAGHAARWKSIEISGDAKDLLARLELLGPEK